MSELRSARSYFLARDLHRNRARKRIQEVRPTATGPDHWHCGHGTWATVVGALLGTWLVILSILNGSAGGVEPWSLPLARWGLRVHGVKATPVPET